MAYKTDTQNVARCIAEISFKANYKQRVFRSIYFAKNVISRFFMKLFKTNNIETVKACQEFFGFQLPRVLLSKRTKKFEIQFYEILRPTKS